MASGSGQEVGNWRLEDGDLDDLLERMLQQNAQDQTHTHRLDATHELLPNIWSPASDVDVKVENGARQPTLQARTFTDVLANMAGDWRGEVSPPASAWAVLPPEGAAAGHGAPAAPARGSNGLSWAPSALGSPALSPPLSNDSAAPPSGLLGLFDTDTSAAGASLANSHGGTTGGARRRDLRPAQQAEVQSASGSPGSSLQDGSGFAGWGIGLADIGPWGAGGPDNSVQSGATAPWLVGSSGADGGGGLPPGSAPAWTSVAAGGDGSAHGGSAFAGSNELIERAISMPDLSYGESMGQHDDSAGGARARNRAAREARPGSKEVHAQRLQQRKTRRREKDRIEEMQTALEELAVEKDKVGRHNASLQAELAADEEELRKLRAAEESALPALADEELAARFGGDVTLTARGPPVTLSPDQIQAMTREELADWWRLYVSKLAGLLESVEGAAGAQPAPDVMQQLQQLQREALFLHIRAAVTNANSVKHFVACGVVDPSTSVPDAPSTPAAWWPIAKALDLAQPQRAQLALLWCSFEARVARVLAARHHLHQRIGATMPNGYMGRDFAVNFLKAHEAMDALKFNLRQEHIVIYDFVSNFHQILTPVQNARCIVRSYPYVPDSAAIATCVAARYGNRSARERLKVKSEAPPA